MSFQLYDDNNSYLRIAFNEFNKLSNNTFDWLEFVNKVYEGYGSSHRMKSDDHVIINENYFYKNLPKILDETPKHVLANYFGWIIVTQLGGYTSSQFKNLSDQYDIDKFGHKYGKLKNNMNKLISKNIHC